MAEPLKIWMTGEGQGMMKGYVRGLFKHFLRQRGTDTDFTTDFDVIFFSVYDPLDVFRLRNLRKKFPTKLIVAGGIEAFSPAYILRYADYAVAGEAYTFLKQMPLDKGVQALRDWMDEQPNIANPKKAGQVIIPDYSIPWDELPVVKLSQHVYYYLCGRGCKNKCAFCFTSWMNPHQINPVHARKLLYQIGKGNSLYYIGNDTGEFSGPQKTGSAISISVKRFLASPDVYRHHKLLHIGVEGWTEARRRWYGKPISKDELKALFAVTKNLGVTFEAFMLIHEPMDVREFIDSIPSDTSSYPRVIFKFTHLDATPNTPIEDYDLSKEQQFNGDFVLGELVSKNRRARAFPVLHLTGAHIRTMLRRASMEQTEAVVASRIYHGDIQKWREHIEKSGLWKLYTGNFEKQFPMNHPHEKAYRNVKEMRVKPNLGIV